MVASFLDEGRLLRGPWQAFERDIARLLIANRFEDVRLVAGSGDRGADVLGLRSGKLWVWQCKFTSESFPPRAAITQVVDAGRFYGADRLAVAASRMPGPAFMEERDRYERAGLQIKVAGPDQLLRLAKESPEYPYSRKTLRDYQDEAVDLLREALLDTGRGQIVMATGLGKTVVMAELVSDLLQDALIPNGRVLVLAHTLELVDQLQRSFWYQLPTWVPTNRLTSVETPALWDGVTFATVQTVASRQDLPDFGLVLVDEAHHIGAPTFQQVIENLDPPMIAGVTATPWRGDGFDIDLMLGPPLVRIGIEDGLRRGFLADVDYRLMADNLDWEIVQKASRNRYSLSQLNRKLIIPTRDERAAQIVADVFAAEGRSGGIVYSPTTLHARHFAAMLRRCELKAEAILSDLDPRDRDRRMAKFRAGQLDVVVTVDLFNEGVDVPDVDLIVFMRATHSRRIFVQQLGRGLRVSPEKDRVVVLDFVTDLRRVAEVVELDQAVRGADIERLGLGHHLVQFSDESAGGFLREWILDQASLLLREEDPALQLPAFNYPAPPAPGGVQ